MRCATCQSDNPTGAKFCNECGTPFPRRCAACGTETPTGAKFCQECGTSLTGKSKVKSQKSKSKSENTKNKSQIRTPELLTSQPSDTGRRTPDTGQAAERRQLTVMFCDLVGSTALSAQLDPEELRDIVRGYQHTSAMVIERFGGHIAQYLGDGLLVYFGYPVAHEDDAARAVRAGLAIIQALQRLSSPQPSQGEGWGEGSAVAEVHPPPPLPRGARELKVRIGIHTGLVVVGEMGGGQRQEQLALGETPNIAARVQGTAQPDEVLISAATYRLVEGLFVCEERGQPELKGVATPLTLYRVIKESEAQSRFQVVARHGLTPLVGREHEYGLLQDRWQRATDGAGQIVLLSGEPGIGKSRLVEALKAHVEHEGARCVELRCSPYAQNSALQPVIEHLQRTLHFRPEDAADEKLQKLREGAPQALPQPETTALLAAVLSLPHPADVPPLVLSPQKQKEKTYEVLVAWLCVEAKQQAVTYAWEDLHWADPSTLEFLTLFLQQVPTTRLLTVLTYRPEFRPPWGSHSYVSQLNLSRLAQRPVEVMVDAITGGKALPTEIMRQITSKTDGVPLFVEELTKMVIESGLVKETNGHYELTGPLPPLAIPSTLQDSLMARLDRFATVREIAQIGATLGREFSYEVLKAVAPLTEEALQQGLRQLVDAELVFQSGVAPQAHYLFKHALIQDTAYHSLLKSRRQQLHQQIAQVFVEQFADIAEIPPELIAHHYTESGLIEQAIPYWQKAGQQAIERSANEEAITHLTRGIELLQTLPETAEKIQKELNLQVTLGTPLQATKGFASPDVEKVYARARDLCQQIGENGQLFPILWGLWFAYLTQAKLQTARETGEQLLTLAQSMDDTGLLIESNLTLGATLFHLGKFGLARKHLEQGIALYDIQKHRSHAFVYGMDPGVNCRVWGIHVLWFLGYPDQALKRSDEAITLARETAHPFSLGFAFDGATWIHQLRRDGRATQEQAEILMAFANEHGFSQLLPEGLMFRGWGLSEQGQQEEGILQIRQGLDAQPAKETECVRPYFLSLLVEAYRKAELTKEGLALLDESLTATYKNVGRFYEAELYRLKGELTLQSQARQDTSAGIALQSEAEAYFLKAIEIARNQQAKSLELRAATSLARLWQQQGKRAEAHKLLSEIYNWFTEGFDTKDLQEAKMLLEDLATQGLQRDGKNG